MHGNTTWLAATVRAARDVTANVREIEIVPDGIAPTWTPGSHIEVGIDVDGRPDTRCYSLVGEPDGTCYRVAVKREPQSRGGSRTMRLLAPSARLRVTPPRNLFELALDRPRYLLIAGGIGITPIYGMALTLARRGAPFRLLYACRSRDEAAYLSELSAALGDRLTFFDASAGRRIDLAAEIAALAADTQTYLCGPLRLLDETRRIWAASGRRPSELRYETFASSGRHAPEPFWLRVPGRDAAITVPADKTALDALAEAGIEVMADCRRGECGLCMVDVVGLTGEIDHRDVVLSDHQKQENTKLCACVSRIVGGGATVDTGYRTDAL
jgi:vanillate O-demethylase ferredoxin subunit